MVHERLDDLPVDELEQALTPVDHGDHGAERREDAGVLHADHAGADHEHRGGNLRQVEDAVGVDDGRAVDRDVLRDGGHRARGDHESLRADERRRSRALDLDRMRVDERGMSLENVNAVARELGAVDVVLLLDHVVAAEHQVVDGDRLLDAVGMAVEPALLEAGEVQHGLAQRLRRDGARVDADAAHAGQALYDGGAAAELGGLDGGVMPRRAAAEDDELILVHEAAILASRKGYRLRARTRRRGALDKVSRGPA